jgi:hypothetical protein
MPNTSNYGFDYESPTSLPGTTLTGGPTTTMPILAVQVDTALASLASTVSDQATTVATLQVSVTNNTTNITNLTNWTREGSALTSVTAADSFTQPVNFGFTFPAAPTVVVNLESGAGATGRWDFRAITVSTTGFTIFGFSNAAGATSTWADIPLGWIAVYRP